MASDLRRDVGRQVTSISCLLLEESVQIAWNYLQRTGELGDSSAASKFSGDVIDAMIRKERGTGSRCPLGPSPPIKSGPWG